MSLYYNDRGVLTYSYMMNGRQVDEDVSRIDRSIIYVRKDGLYWIEGLSIQRLFNGRQTTFIDNYDFTGIVRLIVVNKDTSILVSRENYYIYHKGQVRYTDKVSQDFDLYRFNFIRNGGKLFGLYTFSEILFENVPEDCRFYVQFNNRNFINPHNYFNTTDKFCIGSSLIDVEFMDGYIRIGNLYYVVKDEFRMLYIDISLDGTQGVVVSDQQVMLYYKDRQSIYHQGIVYNVPIGSVLY